MAHTNIQMLNGNLTTGEPSPTFYVDRDNEKVGVGRVPATTGDDASSVLQVAGGLLATTFHGDGSQLTGLTDSKWVEDITNSDNIYYSLGNVGIGTDNPGAELHVEGNVYASSNLEVGQANLFVDTQTSRVGVGTRDPEANLHVEGNVYVSSNLEVGQANLFVDTVSGNVAIGTTSTDQKLTVGGPLRLTDGASNVVDMSSNPVFVGWSEQKIQDSGAQPSFNFGYSVAISEDGHTVVVGAFNDGPNGESYAGSAYIFTRTESGWSQQKIQTSDPGEEDYFGASVSISGDGNTAIVGAPNKDIGGFDAVGAAYIFTRTESGWSEQKIQASDAEEDDRFGSSVSISGDGNTAIVGASYESPDGVGFAGSAYIFTRTESGWSQQKIQATDADQGDRFGYSVAISGDGNTAIVGARNERPTGSSFEGSAYIFTRTESGWSQQKIYASDAYQEDYFGSSVSISGDGNTAIVGAPSEDPDGVNLAGSAYIFTRTESGWSQQKIKASDAQPNFNFGYSVAISSDGNMAIVGSLNADVEGVTTAGAAYIFTRTESGWSQQKIQASDAVRYDSFGLGVSISGDGNTAIVGAPNVDVGGVTNTGAAYIFSANYNAFLRVSTDIEASGTILSFTGQHLCFPEGPIERGLVVSANRNKFMNLNGPLSTGLSAIKSSESLPIVSLSNVVNDPTVFGVVDGVELLARERRHKHGGYVVRSDKEYGDDRAIINSLGEGAMWVVDTNGHLSSGDYITTSSISGYGQKQDDDILHSYTVAKITMDCDFNPPDIPVREIKKDEDGSNILNEYGRLQWEDTDRTEKAYRVRYLTIEGEVTDVSNAVHIAAYVGCTYHCG